MATTTRFDLTRRALTRDEESEVAERLRDGALLIYPTDTLYAIGCRAGDGDAVRRLRDAKGREADKPFPVIASDLVQVRSLVARWTDEAQRLADAFWPGPLTLVFPAASTLPADLLASGTSVAVRVPGSEAARALTRLAGPLVATSANLAGLAPARTVDLAVRAFPIATLLFDLGPLDGAPSTIVDLTDLAGGFRILREGRIDRARIERSYAQSPLRDVTGR